MDVAVFLRLCRVIAVLGITFMFSQTAAALGPASELDDFSWTSTDPSAHVLTNSEALAASREKCVRQSVKVGGVTGEDATVCVHYADGWRYGLYSKYIATSSWSGYMEQVFLIGFAADAAMYKVRGLPGSTLPVYRPQSNDLIYTFGLSSSTRGQSLNIVRNVFSKLEKVHVASPLPAVEYRLKQDSYEYLLRDEIGGPAVVNAVGASANGRWLAVEMQPGGLLRIDMETSEKTWFSKYIPSYGYGSDGLMEFSVSNDGRFVAAAGLNIDFQVVNLHGKCGMKITVFYREWRSNSSALKNPCPSRNASWPTSQALGDSIRSVTLPQFSFDGGELTVFVEPYWRSNVPFEKKWIRLRASGYKPSAITYLAMGDSYSSGEGDIDRKSDGSSYYQPHTDTDDEDCHVSERSYPFHLQRYFGIASERVRSVACSGALVYRDYTADSSKYFGQNERLGDEPKSSLEQLRAEGLKQFIPGRVPQLEFIKKYQPSVVTLTGGGNDVGFAKILEYCASYYWEAIATDTTCDYAKEGSYLRSLLGRSIHDQYYATTSLVEKIKSASPVTKVYVVGYPSFIAGSMASCALNSGALNGRERDMINEGVSYLNQVLKKAAEKSGAYFVDIEDSLRGGRLCEGSEYVTGVSDAHFDIKGSRNEMFHPNADGHLIMAESIIKDGFSPAPSKSLTPVGVNAPAMPVYFGESNGFIATARQAIMVAGGEVMKGGKAIINLISGTIGSNISVTIRVYSDPVLLGSFHSKEDGSLSEQIEVPESLPAGRHVLVVSTKSPSGESVDYYQFVQVRGADPADVDDDGVSDEEDNCLYMSAWYDERTGLDVCAAPIQDESSISFGSPHLIARFPANGKEVEAARSFGVSQAVGATTTPLPMAVQKSLATQLVLNRDHASVSDVSRPKYFVFSVIVGTLFMGALWYTFRRTYRSVRTKGV